MTKDRKYNSSHARVWRIYAFAGVLQTLRIVDPHVLSFLEIERLCS